MSDDEEIQRAIALSLQEAAKPNRKPIIISDEEDEEEDEDAAFAREIQRAIEASKSGISTPGTSITGSNYSSKSPTPPREPQAGPSSAPSAFISERAKLEKERLERQKRLRPDTSLDEDDYRSAKRQQHQPSADSRTKGKANANIASSSQSATKSNVPTIEQVFWDGEARQVANRYAEPRKDGRPTFRLTEVFGKKSDISFAILSSYSLALSWIYEFFDRSTPVIMVAHDPARPETMHNVFPNWVRTAPKLPNGRGCMHMKFMLIFYKTGRLRVVISTANLIDIDWRDIENTVWVHDIPLRSSPIPHDPKVVDDFPAMMQHVLHKTYVRPALGALRSERPDIPIKVIEDLRCRWDWSKVKAKLVPSIAGKHEGWPRVLLTGHVRLMKAVRDMGLRTGQKKGKNVDLEYQGSSIGTYSTQWMNEFHWSARGESAEDWLDIKKAQREKQPYPPVKIIFPSLKTIKATTLGEPGGGTMFCSKNQWKATRFPREKFHDSKSRGGPVLMHSKMILALMREDAKKKPSSYDSDTESDTDTDTDDDVVEIKDERVGWAYVGSHNFTPSAWGNLSGSSFNPILNVTNYELGVVFPLKDDVHVERVVCWERPARKYVLGDDLPWMQDESDILRRLRGE